MMGRIGFEPIVIVCFALALALIIGSNFTSGLIVKVSKEEFAVNELVPILVENYTPQDSGALLILRTGNHSSFREIEGNGRYLFSPKATGEYSIEVLHSGVFKKFGGFTVLGSQVSYHNLGGFLNKHVFELGDIVSLVLNNVTGYKGEINLKIKSPSSVYSYTGEFDKPIAFIPPEIGEYKIQVSVGGELVGRDWFRVVGARKEHSKGEDSGLSIKIKRSDGGTSFARVYRVVTEATAHTVLRFENGPVKDIDFIGNVEVENRTLFIESVPLSKTPAYLGKPVDSFAIDPTQLNFTEAKITKVAKGRVLYKCKDYNFSAQRCEGRFERVTRLIPGEVYTITLTPEDPLWSELDDTINCSCTASANQLNFGTISCSQFCAINVSVPSNALSGFIREVRYNVTVTIDTDNTAFTNTLHEGKFDHDATDDNSNEVVIGNSTSSTTFTAVWTRTDMDSTGNYSFSKLDCSNWNDGYCTYYIFLATSTDFQAPGKSLKSPSVTIELNWINYTWNYTEPGDVVVQLNYPEHNSYVNSMTITFNFTPSSSSANFTNCTLYTNETSWSVKAYNETITNNASNYITTTFGSEGSFIWNVKCTNENNVSAFSSDNYTLTIDTVSPIVKLESPANNSVWTSSGVVEFVYNVSDTSPISNCSLIINGVVYQTDTSITKDISQAFYQSLQNGIYTWRINCTDEAGNINTSEERVVNVSQEPILWSGKWYEGYTSSFDSIPANITLANNTDGTSNYVYSTINPLTSLTILSAVSNYIDNNGGYIPAGGTINFRAFFSYVDGVRLYTKWRLYKVSDTSSTLICEDSVGEEIPGNDVYTSGSCSPSSEVRIAPEDKLEMILIGDNQHPSQTRTFNHTIDHINSYVDIVSWHNIGFLDVDLVYPTNNVSVLQGENFTVLCNVACSSGECLDIDVVVQYNTSTQAWTNISNSGNIVLNGSSNPQNIGNLSSNNTNVSFNLKGNVVSVNWVRCVANSKFSNASSETIIKVTVQDNAPPAVALSSPSNRTWLNYNTDVVLYFTASDASGLSNCSLYINGVYNQSKGSSQLNNGGLNNFTLASISDGSYNWSVTCWDSNGLSNTSEVWWFYIDTSAPGVVLNAPQNGTVQESYTVTFNFTATDNLATQMLCNLTLDGSIEASNMQANSSELTSVTVSNLALGVHYWNVTCWDNASNQNTSQTWLFNITDNPPVVALYSPANMSWTNNNTVVLYFNASDNDGFQNCTLILNGNKNQTLSSSQIVNGGLNNFTLTNLSDGLYNWTVNCTDTGNFTAQPSEWYFYVDTGLPWVELNSPIDLAQLSSTPVTFNFTAYDSMDSSLTCNITIDGIVSQSGISAQNATPTTQAMSNVNDGFHYWNVTCSDDATNSNISVTRGFNLSEPPQVAQNYPSANQHTLENITFLFTISDNDGFENCSILIDNVIYATKQGSLLNNGAQNNITLYSISEGYHNWSVLCYDNGTYLNSNQTPNIEFVVDDTPPYIVLNFPGNSTSVNSSSVNFNFTGYDNLASQLTCNITISGGRNATGLSLTSGVAYNKTFYNFSNGVYYWNVTCVDQAGKSNISSTYTFNVSVPPQVVLNYPTFEPFWDDTGIDAYFEYIPYSNGNLSNCSLMIDGIVNMTDTTVTEGAINSFETNLSEGYHNWTVRCYDIGGLYGEATPMRYYVDVHAPTITLNTPGNGTTLTSNYVTYNFTAYDNMANNMTCNLTVNDGTGAYVEVANIIVYNATPYNVTKLYHDGNYTWNVTCKDLAKHVNTSATFRFTVEAPPNVTLLKPDNGSWSSVNNVTLTYYAYDPYSLRNCTLWLNGAENATDTDPVNGGNNTFNLTGLSDGLYNWTVSCIDVDFNNYQPPAWNFYVDTKAPWVVLNQPSDGENFSTTTVELNFTPLDGTSTYLICNVTVDSTVVSSNINISNNQSYSLNVSSLNESVHYWNVTCKDIVGFSNVSETRAFNVFVPPQVVLVAPDDGYWSNNPTQVFYFNVSDDTGIFNCSLIINGSINQTKTGSELVNNAQNNFTVSGLNGTYSWAVRCYDNTTYFMMNQTSNRSLYVDLDEPIPSIETQNKTWFNTQTPSIDFNITDNMAPTLSYEFYVDSTANKNGSVTAGVSTSTTLNPISEGQHAIVLEATDLAGNSQNSSTTIIYVDTHAPWVELNYPPNGNESESVHVEFNFTVYDQLSENFTCQLTVDGSVVSTVNATNATPKIVNYTVSPGLHWWNVTCFDLANNQNTSATWNFTAPAPDLVIKSEWITFNESNLEENHNITINVTIANYGGTNATNAVVQFFDGDPDNGGVQINGNKSVNVTAGSNTTTYVIWQPSIGVHNIYVLVDPPLATNGSIIELNESNNIANTTVQVVAWHYIVGNVTGDLEVADSSYNITFRWAELRTNNTNIYAADSDSNINWDELAAISKNTTGGYTGDDFEEIDTRLGTSGFLDSVNATFTSNGQPRAYSNFTVYGKAILDVPVVNTTNTSAFVTGILWDYGDGGVEYNGSQDIVFITKTNLNTTGAYGRYDFELKIPAQLRGYVSPDNEVALYLELTG